MIESKDRYFHPKFHNYACDKWGTIYSMKQAGKQKYNPLIQNNGKQLKEYDNGNGYLFFWIYDNKKKIKYYSHRFVYECVHNKLLDKSVQIDHKDKHTKNNDWFNLQEASRTTNSLNRFENKEVVDLPEDSVPVTEYGTHKFTNLYYSASNNCLYKKSEKRTFMIQFKEYKYEKNGKKYSKYSTQLRDSDKKQANIHLQKLLKTLGLKNKSE